MVVVVVVVVVGSPEYIYLDFIALFFFFAPMMARRLATLCSRPRHVDCRPPTDSIYEATVHLGTHA